jgi:FtsH-binding integral membrane protein
MIEEMQNQAVIKNKSNFLTKTYSHLLLGVLLFAFFSYFLYIFGFGLTMFKLLSIQFMIFVVFILYVGASTLAQNLAYTKTSKPVQYLGMAVFALVEAVFFSPLILIAAYSGLLLLAIGITGVMFVGLTLVALFSGKDFSFLRNALLYAGIVAGVCILASFIWPAFFAGIWFSAFMILLAGGYILYDTNNLLKTVDEEQYIGASVTLLASLLLLFWYVIRFLLQFSRR